MSCTEAPGDDRHRTRREKDIDVAHHKARAALSYLGTEFKPQDWLRFVQLDPFPKRWEDCGLDGDDLQALEVLIMTAGRKAPVIRGTGGLRKVRFGRRGDSIGKSGGVRVCFALLEEYGTVLLVTAYPKGEKGDLTGADRAAVRAILGKIRERLDKGLIR